MINYTIRAGQTDFTAVIRIIDSTDGTPETGVVFNTAGIDLKYRREGAVNVDITEATLAALTTAHTDGGFLHIGNGYYRLDLPDAAVAVGVAGVLVHGVVTGMVVIGCYVQLVAYNPADGVRLGLTALPNAAAEAAGGLYTRGSGAGQINQPGNGSIDANVIALSNDQTAADNAEAFFDGTGYSGTNNVIPTVTSVTGSVGGNVTGSVGSLAAQAKADVNAEVDTAIVDATLATAASVATVDTVVDAVKVVTDRLQTAIELDGAFWRFTEEALELAPSGGGGGSSAEDIADEIFDRADAVEGGVTFIEAQRAILAACAGISTKVGTTSTFKNPAGTITRITATTPGDGTRTAITLNLS